jgi:hypothetical protein
MEAAACTRVIPFPGFRRKESRERSESRFRYRQDSEASTSSIGSAHKQARDSTVGACDEVAVCAGLSCVDVGRFKMMFWFIFVQDRGSLTPRGSTNGSRRKGNATRLRQVRNCFNSMCNTVAVEAVSRMLGRLQDYSGWEEASHVRLTLHRSAKAIVRHTWRDICMSQRMQDTASINRRVRRKSQKKH